MTFENALTVIKEGGKVRRTGWNGTGMWIAVQYPDAGSLMTAPYIYMRTADGSLTPWLASQADLLSNDWTLL